MQAIIPLGSGNGALRLTTARYFTPSGRSIQAKGISPDIEVLQDVPDDLKARIDTGGEASLRGHLKAEGDEQTGSQSYIPPDPKDDKALHAALDLIRGIRKIRPTRLTRRRRCCAKLARLDAERPCVVRLRSHRRSWSNSPCPQFRRTLPESRGSARVV